MTHEEIKTVIENHRKWSFNENGGSRADLCGADLCDADLRGAYLRGAYLLGANLCGANLRGADLRDADLRGANLCGADLRGADLRGAYLLGANLCGANLRDAENINEVNWSVLTAFYAIACPESGSFIGWKKACGYIVKLRIPEDAKRSSATSRKCRCNKAEVLGIETLDGKPADFDSIYSSYDSSFIYRVGETVEVADFDDDRWNECSRGIHFFITRDEAVKY